MKRGTARATQFARAVVYCTVAALAAACAPAAAASIPPTPVTVAASPTPVARVQFTPPPTVPVMPATRSMPPSTRPAPAPTPIVDPRRLDAIVQSWGEDEAFSGSVLVARNGAVLLDKGYGLADQAHSLPNTPQTRYRIASISKSFTAAAILMLEARGKLTVNDPACRYLASCPDAWRGITIHQLLTHTSGLHDFLNDPEFALPEGSPPSATLAWLQGQPLDFPPGERWSYSNSGYLVLGLIVEQASGQSYEAFLQRNIWQPLKMKATGYDHNQGGLAVGYDAPGERGDRFDMALPFAAGGLYSTVDDLYRWDQALYGSSALPRSLVERMFVPYVDTAAPQESGLGYGYGWFVYDWQGRPVQYHSGMLAGFSSTLLRLPRDKVAVIILSNYSDQDLKGLQMALAQAVLGLK